MKVIFKAVSLLGAAGYMFVAIAWVVAPSEVLWTVMDRWYVMHVLVPVAFVASAVCVMTLCKGKRSKW